MHLILGLMPSNLEMHGLLWTAVMKYPEMSLQISDWTIFHMLLCTTVSSALSNLTFYLHLLTFSPMSLSVTATCRHRRMRGQKHDRVLSDLHQLCGELQVWVWERLFPGRGWENMHQGGERWEDTFSLFKGTSDCDEELTTHCYLVCVCVCRVKRGYSTHRHLVVITHPSSLCMSEQFCLPNIPRPPWLLVCSDLLDAFEENITNGPDNNKVSLLPQLQFPVKRSEAVDLLLPPLSLSSITY